MARSKWGHASKTYTTDLLETRTITSDTYTAFAFAFAQRKGRKNKISISLLYTQSAWGLPPGASVPTSSSLFYFSHPPCNFSIAGSNVSWDNVCINAVIEKLLKQSWNNRGDRGEMWRGARRSRRLPDTKNNKHVPHGERWSADQAQAERVEIGSRPGAVCTKGHSHTCRGRSLTLWMLVWPPEPTPFNI